MICGYADLSGRPRLTSVFCSVKGVVVFALSEVEAVFSTRVTRADVSFAELCLHLALVCGYQTCYFCRGVVMEF